jgi:hypothetical protein
MVIFNRGKFLAIWRGFSSPPQFKLFPRNVDQSYGFTIVRQFPLLVVALFTFISGERAGLALPPGNGRWSTKINFMRCLYCTFKSRFFS